MSTPTAITKQGFEIVGKGLELYHKVLDEKVHWKSIEQTVKTLNNYSNHYSNTAAGIIGEIKTLTNNATDQYFMAKQSIQEWCSLAVRLIAAYKFLFDKHDENNFPAQKQLLLKVLDDGMEKMTAAHVKLEGVSTNFDLAVGKLTLLLSQLRMDFDNRSDYVKTVNDKIRRKAYGSDNGMGVVSGPFGLIFSESFASTIVDGETIPEMQRKFNEIQNFYENLKTLLEKASVDIRNAKKQLDSDIESIGIQSAGTEEMHQASSMDMNRLHDDIVVTLDNLIVACEDFKQKYD